jgi:hypothetical protein
MWDEMYLGLDNDMDDSSLVTSLPEGLQFLIGRGH